MFERLINLSKEKGNFAVLFLIFKSLLYKAFGVRVIGSVTFASVATERKVFSDCELKYSEHGYYFVDPMPSAEALDQYYSSFYWDPRKKAKKVYGANTRDFLHYLLLKEYAPEDLGEGKVLLNFGAGHGGISHLCWLNGMHIVNVEPSLLPEFYEERWQTFADISEVADGSIDFVYGSHSLEHVRDIEESKKEFERVLKPNGLLFWEVPNADNCNVGSQRGRIDIPHTYYFKSEFFKNWFSEVLLCDGFDQQGWKETNIIGTWSEYRDKEGIVIRALGRIA